MAAIQNSALLNTGMGSLPAEGPKTVAYVADFSLAREFDIDLYPLSQTKQILAVQSVFIDNSLNDQPINLTCPDTQQQISIGAGWQGYFPLTATSRMSFTVQSDSTLKTAKLLFYNIPIAGAVWPGSAPPFSLPDPLPVSDSILDALVVASRFNVRTISAQATDVNWSGTIALGGTAQVAAAANPNRRGYLIQNIDETNSETFYFSTVGAATIGGAGSFALSSGTAGYPGGTYQGTGSGAISVIAATTGHKFSLIEW